jgi:N-acetyl sugar amidotransferase
MKYCITCLSTDTRPNTLFSQSGKCPACEVFISHEGIDWDSRKKELQNIVQFGKDNSSGGYDCIVGVSGGKDSTLQALYVRDVLKMNPLLVSLNYPPEHISITGAKNISNLISHGFDCINVSCAPKTWKVLMKHALVKYGNWAKATEIALFSSVPRAAIAHKIPLIWWGENASVVLGDLKMAGATPSDGNRLKYSNTLDGGNVDWITELGFEHSQVMQYLYPTDENMNKSGLKIIFLAHFWDEFTPFINGNRAAVLGLEVKTPNIYDADFWGTSMLDEDFMTVNMMIKWLKFGFGKATDNVNDEIRIGRMTRDQAKIIVEKFDGKCPDNIIDSFCRYLDIGKSEFWLIVDKFVDKKLFTKISEGLYKPNFKVGINFE